MSDDPASVLRAAFDRRFVDAPAPPPAKTYDYLRVRVDGLPYVIALAEVASLHADLHVVPVPSPAPELLGIAAVRASVVPIYDLALALGAGARASSRWTVLVRAAQAGFSFDGFEGHARTPDRGEGEPGGARALVTLDGRAHPVISLASLLGAIQSRWSAIVKETR